MAEIDQKQYEKDMIRNALIAGFIALVLILILVLWGFKILLGL